MSVTLITTTVKSFLSMSHAERENVVSLMDIALKNKTVLVLGHKCCFFCGAELGAVSDIEHFGKGDRLIYINTCPDCADLVPFT